MIKQINLIKSYLISGFILLSCSQALFGLTITDYENPLDVMTPKKILRTPIGTRATGLAAFTGNADDLSAVFFNPAGLSKTNYWEIQMSHRDDQAKVDFDSVVANIPFSRGSVAIYGVLAHVYDYENTYYGAPDNPYNSYIGGYGGISTGVSVIKNMLSLGLGVKWLSLSTHSEYNGDTVDKQMTGLAIDAAAQFDFDLSRLKKVWSFFYYLPRFTGSVAAMNIHPKLESEKDFEGQTGSLNFGLSFHYSQTFALNVDFINPIEIDTNSVRMGIEFWPAFFLSIRGGVVTKYVYDHFTYFAGFGIGNIVGGKHLSLEYAFEADMSVNDQLEHRHQISIVLSFGGTRYIEKIKDEKPYEMHRLQR